MKVIKIALRTPPSQDKLEMKLGSNPSGERGSGVISWRVKITSKSLSFHHIQHSTIYNSPRDHTQSHNLAVNYSKVILKDWNLIMSLLITNGGYSVFSIFPITWQLTTSPTVCSAQSSHPMV